MKISITRILTSSPLLGYGTVFIDDEIKSTNKATLMFTSSTLTSFRIIRL